MSPGSMGKRTVLVLALVMAVVGLSFASGYIARGIIDPFHPEPYPLLDQVTQILQVNGLKPIPTGTALEYGLVQGMLNAYDDPYTIFVEPVQNTIQTAQLQGKTGGIGVRLERDSQGNVVLYPVPDSPALQAGVRDGDRLLQVADQPVTSETTLDKLQAAIHGPVGQTVTLVIAHAPEYQPEPISLKRAEVAVPSTTWNLLSDDARVGVIHTTILAATTPDEIREAVVELQQQGATHFILDLRNNGGGLVNAGVDTARLFLKEGMIIEQQYRGEPKTTEQVEHPGEFSSLPLVLWINENTASSAEIVAGALKAARRAQLIGVQTYGKDSIQLVFNLKDGSSLHVTSARWSIPGLKFPDDGHGLMPDVQIPDDAEHAPAWIKASLQALGR